MGKFRDIFAGILIGAGVVLPGVSGSVIAIMMGVYEPVIQLFSDCKLNIVRKIKKIMPLMVGIMVGIMSVGKFLSILFEQYEVEMKYIFAGLILGGIPALIAEFKKKTENKSKLNYLYLTIAFIFSLLLLILPNIQNYSDISLKNISFFKMLLSGILYISGKIIPGISSSFFLMLLGLYNYMLDFLSNPFSFSLIEYVKFIPFVLGIIIGIIVLVKLINYLFQNHFSKTYSVIVGFVLGSIFSILPKFRFEPNYIISILLMITSFILINKMSKK